MSSVKGLRERLKGGEVVICAEGYLFEFERRGYLKAGAFVPEVVIEHPDLVEQLYEEFVRAGSDVVQAFTYYGNREKLGLIGREGDLEKLNRRALQMARKVADRTGTLMAGNICNSNIYNPDDPKSHEAIASMFKEQIEWAVEEGADFIIGETYPYYGEIKMALDSVKRYGNGLPCVLTFMPRPSGKLPDGPTIAEACLELEKAGADVVGVNCIQGPTTIVSLMKEIRKACKGPVACLPVVYRTRETVESFINLTDPITGVPSFPIGLDCWHCTRADVTEFTQQLVKLGVNYMGLCCGNQAHYTRAMAEAVGRKPPASKYSPDMCQHFTQLAAKGETYKYNVVNSEFDKLIEGK